MSKRKALVIGIDKYPSTYALNGCVNDAGSVYNLLKEHGDGGENFDVKLLVDTADKKELKDAMIRLFKPKSEIALLYFAGHGMHDFFGYHLVAPDFKQHDLGVPMSQLYTIIRKSGAKNKIVILDCCHAAGAEDEFKTTGMATYLYEGVTILASSKHDEGAIEVNGHGVFTNLLIAALNGGAADLSGNITPGGIYAFIDKALGEGQQRPVFKTNTSEFVSLRKVVPQVSETILQSLPDLFSTPQENCLLNPSYEKTNNPKKKHIYQKPYAVKRNILKFKQLQKLQSIGLVVPVGEEHMYYAAMKSKACKLTPLGQHYWRLAKEGKI